MSFFDDMKETIVTAGKDVSQKAKEVSEVTKLKLEVKTKQDFIEKKYRELGKKYFEENKDSELAEDSIIAIKDALAEIDNLKEEILKTQGSVKCPKCGALLPEQTSFCNRCGEKLD